MVAWRDSPAPYADSAGPVKSATPPKLAEVYVSPLREVPMHGVEGTASRLTSPEGFCSGECSPTHQGQYSAEASFLGIGLVRAPCPEAP